MEENLEGDTSYYTPNGIILEFTENDSVKSILIGYEGLEYFLTYRFTGDSLFLKGAKSENAFPIFSKKTDQFKIALDSNRIFTYQKLATPEREFDLVDIRENIANSLWAFEANEEEHQYIYAFSDTLKFPSLIQPPFKSLQTKINHHVREDAMFWSLVRHNGVPILKVQDERLSFFNHSYIIKKYDHNRITMSYWEIGREYTLEGKKLRSWDRDKVKAKLTSKSWRFSSEKIPKPSKEDGELMDLGTVDDYFEEISDLPKPEYLRDSTLLITGADLAEKSLIIKFNIDQTYQILRQERVLDEGIWSFIFGHRVLQLTSQRESGEGLYGGYIHIKKVTKNRLILRRQLTHELDHMKFTYSNHLETYKPLKN